MVCSQSASSTARFWKSEHVSVYFKVPTSAYACLHVWKSSSLRYDRVDSSKAMLVDGSFVTSKPVPNDIDLLAVLRPGHDFERDLPISECALVSRGLLRRRFGFDVIVAERETLL